MRFLALIPARSGSKRLPGKNAATINGKSLVWYAVKQAHQSKCFKAGVWLTTDDALTFHRGIGVELPAFATIDRPAHLATDDAAMIDVVRHAAAVVSDDLEISFDAIVLLQPTSPLRTAEDIAAACLRMESMQAEALVSVTQTRHPEVYTIGWLNRLRPVEMGKDTGPLVVPNGAIFIITKKALEEGKDWWTAVTCYAYEMPASRSVDIDTADDLEQARRLWTE